MIKHILLVPAPGDHLLLAPGKFGATMPLASRLRGRGDWLLGGWVMPEEASEYEFALVLAGDGEPCVESCDRLWRADGLVPRRRYSLLVLSQQAPFMAARLGGEVVVIEEEGTCAG